MSCIYKYVDLFRDFAQLKNIHPTDITLQ